MHRGAQAAGDGRREMRRIGRKLRDRLRSGPEEILFQFNRQGELIHLCLGEQKCSETPLT